MGMRRRKHHFSLAFYANSNISLHIGGCWVCHDLKSNASIDSEERKQSVPFSSFLYISLIFTLFTYIYIYARIGVNTSVYHIVCSHSITSFSAPRLTTHGSICIPYTSFGGGDINGCMRGGNWCSPKSCYIPDTV